VDPATGLPTTGPPTIVQTRARLSQVAVANVGSQIELLADQNTVISLWSVLVYADVPMDSTSRVVTEDGTDRVFQITGDVADRPFHKPLFRAAAARLLSDMQ
jgi:hypothetical protein